MICPSKICNQEIPDDSIFCDQCGVHLGKCDKCGAIAISKRCGKCGGFINLIPTKSENPNINTNEVKITDDDSKNTTSPNISPSVLNTSSNATVIVANPIVGTKLTLEYSDGWSLDIKHNDILGREEGRHAPRLSVFPVISSRHGQIHRQGDKWFYTDIGSNGLGSTNKSYLNGRVLQANTQYELTDGAELMLANIPFTVKIQ